MGLKFDSILIVTYGRSGSTLLQGILNGINGVLIRGENSNFIIGLYESYKRLKDTIDYHTPLKDTPQDAWFGASFLDIDLFLSRCENMVKELLIGNKIGRDIIKCYGFKEIRYPSVKDLEGYFNFLRRIFPNPCFILNIRNLDEVSKSGWWADQDPEKVRSNLLAFEQRVLQYFKKNKSIFFHIS